MTLKIKIKALLVCGLALGLAALVQARWKKSPTGFYVPIGPDGRAFVAFPRASDFRQTPLEERIYAAPPGLVDYLRISAMVAKRQATPVAVTLRQAPTQLKNLLYSFPPNLRLKLSKELLGIFLAGSIGGDAFSNYCFSSLTDEKPQAAFIALDVGAFMPNGIPVTANAWMTKRESAAFEPDSKTTLEATIAGKPEDGLETALEYALLHELGYVLASNSRIFPTSEIWRWNSENTRNFDFFDLSWKARGQSYESRWDGAFADRTRVIAPDKERLKASEMAKYYDELEKTDLPSLMGAQSPFEDFAESFATYVHTVVMHRPYQIRVVTKGKTVKTIGSCWTEKRCEKKRRVLETVLQSL